MRYIVCMLFAILFYELSAQKNTKTVSDTTISIIRHLEEVVVTAEKKELVSVDVPMAVTVVTEKTLPYENNLDLRNLSGIVPNFYMQEGGLKLSAPLYVRGIGTVSGTPPVGLYVDGVPIFDKNAFVFELYDIKQIEILRGPQTTLYGRNSINGLIHIVTNKPGNTFTCQAKAGIASYNTQTYSLVVNLPVRDILYNKISGSYNCSDGYFRNHYTGKKSNSSEFYNIRYQGNIFTDNRWSLMFGLNYNNTYDEGYAYHAIDSLKVDRYTVNYNTPASYDRNLLSAFLNVKKGFNRAAFQWITSYSWTKDKQLLDADFTFWDVFDNQKRSDQNQMTQEINLCSTGTTHLDWTAGTFSFYKDLNNKYIANFGKDKAKLLSMPLEKAFYFNNTLTYGIAGYGQITIKGILPGLFITAGMRYDYERAELDYRDSIQMTGGRMILFHNSPEEDMEYHEWLPKFSILQKWSDHFSGYATISKGYKAGGYNIIVNEMSSQLVNLDYDKEELWNYEIGIKYFSPRKKFNINASLYYIDWKDQQIFVMGTMGPSIKNAGDAQSIGGEFDLKWEFLPNLTYSLATGYSNSKYYRHDTPDYEGNRIVMAPDFTVNTGLTYNKVIHSPWLKSFSASTSVTGFGTQYFDEANLLKQNPYFQWNMNIFLSCKHFDIHIWGKNLLDKAFFTYMFNSPVGKKLPEYINSGQSGAPVRLGASLSLKF